MKKLLTSVAIACSVTAGAVNVLSSNVPVIYLNDFDPVELAERELAHPGLKLTAHLTAPQQNLYKAPLKEAGANITVKITVNDYDINRDGQFTLIDAIPYNTEIGRGWGYAISDNEIMLNNVIEGEIYDLTLCSVGTNYSTVIVRESISFKEGEDIEVSINEATDYIELHALNPDGSLTVLEKIQDGNVIQEGYFTHQYIRSFIHKDGGQLGVFLGNVFRTLDENGEVTENNIARVRCTPTERMAVAQIDYLYDIETGWTTIFTAAEEFKNCVIKSNPADYYTISDRYNKSRYEYVNPNIGLSNESETDHVNSSALQMSYVCNGNLYVTGNMMMHGEIDEVLNNDIRMCFPPEGFGVHTAMVTPLMVEDPYTMIGSTGDIMGCVMPVAMNTPNGVRRYPFPAHPDWNALNDENGYSIVPLNETISYFDDSSIEYGEAMAPIFDFRMYDYGFANPMFQMSYKGLYGEDRYIDCMPADIHFVRDGEDLWNDYKEIQDFRYSSLNMENIRSKVEMSVVNRNLNVDGLEAFNETQLIYDESLDDFTPPTLSHLSYRSVKTGTITNRFETAEDGKLEMYVGDFFPTSTNNGYGTYYAEKAPASIKVEYSPYGEDLWETLDMVNDENLTLLPGFGHYYSASLKNVEKRENNKWYDLRITLSDESGNTNMQRISPSFMIDESASISSVIGNQGIYVSGNSIIAPEGSTVYDINGVAVGNTNLNAGIYVVRTAGKALKVVVK
ncbi:MAG: hypothetical protein HDR88_18430 [Bacteroides sp.]|nr:hypothetical protein [Bacteroides sp.]